MLNKISTSRIPSNQNIKPNLSLYSPYYAEACNELAVHTFASQRQGNTATCVDVEAVANRLQRCVRFGR